MTEADIEKLEHQARENAAVFAMTSNETILALCALARKGLWAERAKSQLSALKKLTDSDDVAAELSGWDADDIFKELCLSVDGARKTLSTYPSETP